MTWVRSPNGKAPTPGFQDQLLDIGNGLVFIWIIRVEVDTDLLTSYRVTYPGHGFGKQQYRTHISQNLGAGQHTGTHAIVVVVKRNVHHQLLRNVQNLSLFIL